MFINKRKKITSIQEGIRQTCEPQTQTQMPQLKYSEEILEFCLEKPTDVSFTLSKDVKKLKERR